MAILVFILGMMVLPTLAIGQEELSALPSCIDVSEVPMTWGWFGGITVAVISGLAALRPFSVLLLKASALIGPRAYMAAKLFYAAGQAAAVFCVGRPKFAVEASKPEKPASERLSKEPEPPQEQTAQLPAASGGQSDGVV